MVAANLTRGQVERSLTQRIQALYLDKMGQRPGRVICQFFDEKLAIFIEEVTTQSERMLLKTDRAEFAKTLRSHLDNAIKPDLIALIEETVGVPVAVLLSDTDLDSGYGGMIAVLKDVPPVRDLASIPKIKREKINGERINGTDAVEGS